MLKSVRLLSNVLAQLGFLVLSVISLKATATPQTMEKPAVIFLQGFAEYQQERNQLCTVLQNSILDWSMSTVAHANCIDLKTEEQAENLPKVVKSQNAAFFINVVNDNNKSQYKLVISRLSPADSTEPRQVRWEIKKGPAAVLSIQKLIKQYGDFDVQIPQFEKALLDHALDANSNIQKVGDNQYIDKRNKLNLSFEEAYQSLQNEQKHYKNYLAAGLELAVIFGASTYQYYSVSNAANPNHVDWDYSYNGRPSTLKARLSGQAIRFDDNVFYLNVGHYFAGTGYYTAARSAGLDRMDSFLVTLAASSFWEYVCEYREVVSINDQINTSIGGFIIGEAIHQMAKIFESGSKSPLTDILKSVFQTPRHMSNWLQQKADGSKYPYLDSEENPDVWAKFNLAITNNVSSLGPSNRSLVLDSEVISIPMFEEAGRVKEVLTDTAFSELFVEKSINGSADTFKFFAKTALAAYYDKNLRERADGTLEGYNLLIGASSAIDIDEKYVNDDPTNPQSDFRGVVHVVGSTLDFIGYHKGAKFRCKMDLYGDFAMIRSWAYDSYRSTHSVDGVASVLADQDYYYGLGTTADISASVQYGKFEVGASYQRTGSSMINVRQRFAAQTTQLNPTDQIVTEKAWFVYELDKNVKLEFDLENRRRSGQILGGNNITTKEIIKTAKLIYVYR